MKTAAAAYIAAAGFAGTANAFWRMPCGVVQTSRLDPIISPGTISGHVHKISGPPTFNPSSNYQSLTDSRCTSCAVQKDKSAYWTPLMYYQHSNGSFQEVPAGGMVVYYLGRGENASYIQPFPPGFRMLSGNPNVRAYDNSTYTYGGQNGVIYTGGHCQTGDQTCVGGKFVLRTGTAADPPGPVFTGRPVSDRVSFACLDASPQPETPSMTNTQCRNGLRAQIQFPSCWDGVNNWLPGNSHVDYLSQIDNGVCPPTHPVLLPHLFYEVLYGVTNIAQDGGRFVFSMGDPTGYGFHGDFLNGWDPSTLQQAITQCINANPSGVLDECAPLAASLDDSSAFNCPEQPSYYDEAVRGMIGTRLPGCNQVVPGPAPATSANTVCPPNTTIPAVNFTGGSGGSPPTYPAVGSILNGYQYTGCFRDDVAHSFFAASVQAYNMTNAACQAYCASKGLPLAATEYSTQCFCGYSLNPTVNTATSCNGQGMVCGGNASEYCGGPLLLSVFNSTTYKGSYNPQLPQPGKDIDGNFTYLGCASETNPGRALNVTSMTSSNNMTNAACAAFCAAHGQPLFGTEYGSECYCGAALVPGSTLGQAGCSYACSGRAPAAGPFAAWANICGGADRLTVWRNNGVGVALQAGVSSVVTTSSSSLASTVSKSMSVTGKGTSATSTSVSTITKGMPTSSNTLLSSSPGTLTTLKTTATSSSTTTSAASTSRSSTSSFSISSTSSSSPLLVPSPSATVGADLVYLGCATEATQGRALNVTSFSADSMTNAACAAFCTANRLPLFGTEYGRECYCGNAPAPGSLMTDAARCSTLCAGPQPAAPPFTRLPNTCGGGRLLSLWRNTSISAVHNLATVQVTSPLSSPSPSSLSLPLSYKYRGCFAEPSGRPAGRALAGTSYSSSTTMSVPACVAFCHAAGFTLAGTEYASQCFCGSTLSSAPVGDWECDMQCSGDPDIWCGGSARLSVYQAAAS